MTWVKIDQGFARHPKLAQAGPLGMAMQVAALCYCNEYLTDGFVPRGIAAGLLNFEGIGMRMWHGEIAGGGEDASWDLVVEDLIEAGSWEQVPGGFQIHDYFDFQPSRAQVEAERQQRREAGAKGGQAKAKRTAKRPASDSPSGELAEPLASGQAKSWPVSGSVSVMTSSSSGDDDDLFATAVRLVAARRIDQRRVGSDPIQNPAGYMAATVKKLSDELAPAALSILADPSVTTAEELADRLEPSASVRALPVPEEPCDFCDSVRWVEVDGGSFDHCPKCRQAESA